jgi:hypothetical protein
MHRPLFPLAAALLMALGACATTEESSSMTSAESAMPESTATTTAPPVGDTTNVAVSCNAEAARGVVGQAATSTSIEQARSAAAAESVRTLKPGQATTMEFNGNRLNVDVDASNIITNVRCG